MAQGIGAPIFIVILLLSSTSINWAAQMIRKIFWKLSFWVNSSQDFEMLPIRIERLARNNYNLFFKNFAISLPLLNILPTPKVEIIFFQIPLKFHLNSTQ